MNDVPGTTTSTNWSLREMKTMNQQIIHFLVMLLVIGGAFVQSNASAANNEQAEQLFVRRVAPLFHEKCLACHGKDESQIKGGGNKGVRNEWHCRSGVARSRRTTVGGTRESMC